MEEKKMVMSVKELEKICDYIYHLHDEEALDGDEIEQINVVLKDFNGDK